MLPASETRKWVYASGGYLRSPKTGEIAPCKGKPCLISNFELSGHQFGTILKSFILSFQSASIQPSPLESCLNRMQKNTVLGCRSTRDLFFLEKKNLRGCTTQKTELGRTHASLRLGWVHFPEMDPCTHASRRSMPPCKTEACMGPFSENHQKIWMT